MTRTDRRSHLNVSRWEPLSRLPSRLTHLRCYEHSSGPGAVMRWFSDPGGRKKVE